MWWVIFQELRPRSALEIGVYRGQVLSLWGVLADLMGDRCEAWGVSPLDSSGDNVSDYQTSIDYEWDIAQHFRRFDLGTPNLIKAYSQDTDARAFVRSRGWDLIYVDGSHDLDDVVADLNLCTEALREGGILVVDDASLYSDFRPPRFSFKGHPGPSTAIRTAPGMSRMIEIGSCGHNRIFRKTA
jgi:cephalosporin hydroxylase